MQILFNCLRNVEKKVKKKHEMQEMTQNSWIKGELQLNDLNDPVDFISKTKRENYKQFSGESFRNVEWIKGTEGITITVLGKKPPGKNHPEKYSHGKNPPGI